MSIMFDLVDEALDQVSLPVQVGIVVSTLFPVGPRRDHRCCTSLPDHLQEGISVIALIGDDIVKSVPGDQCLPLGDVVALAPGELEAQGVAQRINADVDFGAEPAPAATQGLSLLAAPFLGAPAAQG